MFFFSFLISKMLTLAHFEKNREIKKNCLLTLRSLLRLISITTLSTFLPGFLISIFFLFLPVKGVIKELYMILKGHYKQGHTIFILAIECLEMAITKTLSDKNNPYLSKEDPQLLFDSLRTDNFKNKETILKEEMKSKEVRDEGWFKKAETIVGAIVTRLFSISEERKDDFAIIDTSTSTHLSLSHPKVRLALLKCAHNIATSMWAFLPLFSNLFISRMH